MKKTSLICLLALAITGCADNPERVRNTVIGTGAGAVIGQIWGRNHEATLTGAVIGGLIGSQINNSNGAAYQEGYQQGYQDANGGGYGYDNGGGYGY